MSTSRKTTILLALAGAVLASAVVACEDSDPLPREEDLPNIPREPVDRLGRDDTTQEAMPVRTKVVSDGPSDTITLGAYRAGGAGGGGDRLRGRPPGFPRGTRQEPEDMHAAARDAVSQQRRAGSEACQLAYEAARDLRQARQSKTPGRGSGSVDRDQFIEMCELRPDIEQWCLVPSYVQQHSDECDQRAHTRYARAIERYENRAGGAADDWAPAADPSSPPGPAAVDAPQVGPRRVPGPEDSEGSDTTPDSAEEGE